MSAHRDGAGGRRSPGRLLTRRIFLGAATVAAPVAVAGCHGGSPITAPPGRRPTTTTTAVPPPGLTGDAQVAALAASLEVLAVNAYAAGSSLAATKRLGAVPAALSTYATVAAGHHQAALQRWNQALTSAGEVGASQPPGALQAKVDQMFTRVTSASALARLDLLVEQTAADTYLSVIPLLRSADLVTVAAQLQALDQEHVATLHYLLGSYPAPEAVQNTNMALRATDA